LAINIFKYQYATNVVYKQYVDLIGVKPKEVNSYVQIPFLPISFFKTHKVITSNTIQKVFMSSGTTQNTRSKHYVSDIKVYEKSFVKAFENVFEKTEDIVVLALLPSYLEQGDSSLIYMTDFLIKKTKNKHSGYFLNNRSQLSEKLSELEAKKQKYVLFGVSYALLDFVEDKKYNLKYGTVIETGGMKGRRKELTKPELHEILEKGFGTKNISSEYGMTELLSQAYSKENQIFETPSWMKILIRDTGDPFELKGNNKTGLINVIDLANVNSCSFIATDDLGKTFEDETFKVLGRFDNSDVRGCNLLVQ
jgi:hypothetical protein